MLLHDALQALVHFLRDQERRMLFWDISRPEVATPPALAALPGP